MAFAMPHSRQSSFINLRFCHPTIDKESLKVSALLSRDIHVG